MHDDTKKLYAEVREVREEMLDDALDVILGGHTRPAAAASSLNELVVYNTTSFAWREVVWVPLAGGNSALRTQVAQLAADGKEGYALVHVACDGGVGTYARVGCVLLIQRSSQFLGRVGCVSFPPSLLLSPPLTVDARRRRYPLSREGEAGRVLQGIDRGAGPAAGVGARGAGLPALSRESLYSFRPSSSSHRHLHLLRTPCTLALTTMLRTQRTYNPPARADHWRFTRTRLARAQHCRILSSRCFNFTEEISM